MPLGLMGAGRAGGPARRIAARRNLGSPLSAALVTGLAVAVAVAAAAAPLCAQDIQAFHPALSDNGFLGVDATRTPGSLRGSAHLVVDMAFAPLRIRTANGVTSLVDRRLALHLGAELGLWGRGAIALRLPMVPYQHNALPGVGNGSFALSDPQLLLRYRFLGASMADRDEPHDGPGMALQASLGLPFGKGPAPAAADAMLGAGYPFTSDGRVRSELSLIGDFQLLGAGVAATLGWRHHYWQRASLEAKALDVQDQLTFGAALKLPIPVIAGLAGILEVRGASGFNKFRDTPLELGLAAKLTIGDFVIVLGGGVGLTRALGTPGGRLLLGVYGVMPEGDQDHDGVPDADDACAFLAEDMDGFQDDDGCPDPDNDNDLVPDLDDKCPMQPAEEGRDEDEDGCTDAAPGAAPTPSSSEAAPVGAGAPGTAPTPGSSEATPVAADPPQPEAAASEVTP